MHRSSGTGVLVRNYFVAGSLACLKEKPGGFFFLPSIHRLSERERVSTKSKVLNTKRVVFCNCVPGMTDRYSLVSNEKYIMNSQFGILNTCICM